MYYYANRGLTMGGNAFSGVVLHLMTGAVLISFSPVFAKLAGSATTATGFYRMLFGLLGLLFLFVFGGKFRKPSMKGFLTVGLSGIFFSLDIYFWHKSILYVGPGLSTLLANFQVFFLAAIDIAVFRQKMSGRLFIAVAMALCGLYLLVGSSWSAGDAVFRTGVVYGLMTAMMYSGYILTLRMAGSMERPVDKRLSMLVVTGVSCVLLGLTAYMSGESLHIADMRTGIYLVSYGVLCQAFGWVIIASALPKAKLTVGGLILLLQPTLAYVWDVFIFSKAVTPAELTGAAVAITAIYLGTLRNT